MTGDQATDFEKKVKDFPGKPKSLLEFGKPWVDALRKRNGDNPNIRFYLISGSDVGERDILFVFACFTPLKYGFTTKALVKYTDGTAETKYFETTNSWLREKDPRSIDLVFHTEKLASVDFLILTRDGKNLLEGRCVVGTG